MASEFDKVIDDFLDVLVGIRDGSIVPPNLQFFADSWHREITEASKVLVETNEKQDERSSGVDLIAAERQRQVDEEGWTSEHDDQHGGGELTYAAVAYALEAAERLSAVGKGPVPPLFWPWKIESYKPVRGPAQGQASNLIKAGALIAAEIDRLQRSEG